MFSAPLLVTFVFAPIILMIGVMTSFEDAVSFRIHNRWVLIGILYSLFVYMLCLFFSVCGIVQALPAKVGELVQYLLSDMNRWVATCIISFFVGYVLWQKNIWGGGDAKLFLCYAMLTPIGLYRHLYFDGYFASFLLLQVTFIPAMLFLFGRIAFFRIYRGEGIIGHTYVAAMKNWISMNLSFKYLGGFLKTSFGFLGLLLFSMMVSLEFSRWVFSLGLGQNITLVLLLLFYKGLSRFFRRNVWVIVVMYIVLAVMIIVPSSSTVKTLFFQLPRAIALTMLTGFIAPALYRMTDVYFEQIKSKYSFMAIWMFIATCFIWIW